MKKTAIYSVLHLLVDGVCAFAMLGRFASGDDNAVLFLIYNFCAFALQMPIGALTMAILLRMAFEVRTTDRTVRGDVYGESEGRSAALAIAGCFAVVVLRSYIGLAVTFSWRTTFAYGLICTLAVVFGKMTGGILEAKFGKEKVVITSLLIAAAGYWFSAIPFAGIAALFFFNMTMPITLHILTEKFPVYSGFAFGLLTFALFLGFLPIGLGIRVPVSGNVTGMIGSIVSAVVLLLVLQNGAKERQGG